MLKDHSPLAKILKIPKKLKTKSVVPIVALLYTFFSNDFINEAPSIRKAVGIRKIPQPKNALETEENSSPNVPALPKKARTAKTAKPKLNMPQMPFLVSCDNPPPESSLSSSSFFFRLFFLPM